MAQQQLDSKLELGRIVDIRKKVFSEVKVCRRIWEHFDDDEYDAEILQSRFTNWWRAANLSSQILS